MLALHHSGCIHHGVDANGVASDMLAAGVVEPLLLRRAVLKHATECITAVTKIRGEIVNVSCS